MLNPKPTLPNRFIVLLFVTAMGVPLVVGCDGRPKRVPVSGQVLIDGKPLTYGAVRFVPSDARQAGGQLDTEGKFALSCFEIGDGVVLGTHRVEVDAGERLSDTKTRWHAPKKYADQRTSGLTREIDGPKEDLLIELTWDGGKPFIEVDRGEAGTEEEGPPGRRKRP
jgi:hypothetical protein